MGVLSALLYRVVSVGLAEKKTFEQVLNDVKELALQILWGNAL